MDTRVNRLYNGYSIFGGVQFRLDQLLSDDGIGTLSHANAITQAEFTFRPTLGIWVVATVNIQIVETPMLNLLKYGDNELTDGIVVSVKHSDGSFKHIYTPKPITRIADWSLVAQSELQERAVVVLQWRIGQVGVPTLMDADAGEYFSMNVPEAPTGLDSHYIQLQGYRITRWDS